MSGLNSCWTPRCDAPQRQRYSFLGPPRTLPSLNDRWASLRTETRFLMKIIFRVASLILIAGSANAQRFAFGVAGGIPFSDANRSAQIASHLSGSGLWSLSTHRYTVGGTFEIAAPFRLHLEVDALYKRTDTTQHAFFSPSFGNITRLAANSWEFPMLLGPTVPFFFRTWRNISPFTGVRCLGRDVCNWSQSTALRLPLRSRSTSYAGRNRVRSWFCRDERPSFPKDHPADPIHAMDFGAFFRDPKSSRIACWH